MSRKPYGYHNMISSLIDTISEKEGSARAHAQRFLVQEKEKHSLWTLMQTNTVKMNLVRIIYLYHVQELVELLMQWQLLELNDDVMFAST